MQNGSGKNPSYVMSIQRREFATPALVGDRFETDSPSIPLDALSELVAYQELVVELAKELARSTTRSGRVPRNFMDKFELRLTGIERGSAVAQIERVFHVPEGGPQERYLEPDEFDSARDLLTTGIEYFEAQGRLPEAFPPNVIPLFKKFGRSLRDGEAIVLRRATNGQRTVAYTPETRKRLVLLTSDSYTREVQLKGHIVGLDAAERFFRLRTDDEGDIHVPYPGHMHSVLTSALRDFKFTQVEVVGIATFNQKDVFQEFEELPTVTLESNLSEADVRDVESQLREFERLERGWLDGEEGEVPSKEGLDWARSTLLALMASYNVPLPYLYPTPEGGVQAEWSFKPWEVSATFNLAKKTAHLHAAHLRSGETRVDDVGFTDDEDRAQGRIAGFVMKYEVLKEQA